MKNKFLRTVSIVLAAAMIFTAIPLTCFAGTVITVTDADQRAEYFGKFNSSVNALKTSMPYLKMTSSVGLARAATGSREVGEELSPEAKKYLAWLLDACLVDGSGLAETLYGTINGTVRLPEEYTFVYGERRDNRLPLVGKTYVSGLAVNDDFTLKTRREGGSLLHPELEKTYIRLDFPDVSLEEAHSTSLSKIFDLPSAVLDPVIVSGDPSLSDSDGRLSDVKLDEFAFDNAYVEAEYDHTGALTGYTSSIDYVFELSLYDAVRMVSAYTGIDFAGIALSIAETVYEFSGEGESGKNILKNSVLYVTYNASVTVSAVNWDKRFFGDTDNNGSVDSTDARLILRHSVGLIDEEFLNQMNEIYSDLDFDGEITSADARTALRISVGLDEAFTDVPPDKDIKIVFVGDIEVPEDPVDPEKPVSPFDPSEITDPEQPQDEGSLGEIVAYMVSSITELVEYFKNVNDQTDPQTPAPDNLSDIFNELLRKIIG